MKRKKWMMMVCLVMGFWLVFSLQVAFGVTLRFAHSTTGGAQRIVLNKIIAAFEQMYPDVKVKEIVQDADVYEDEGLITLVQSKTPPDVYFQWGGDLVRLYAESGFGADLTAALEKGGWKDTFLDAAWPDAMYEGKIYLIPTNLDVTTVLWYNEVMFEETGVTAPETWSEFMNVCAKLKENGITPVIVGNKELWPLGNWAGHIVGNAGGADLYDNVFTLKEDFANPDFIRAFGLFEEMAEKGYFNEGMNGMDADPGMMGFFQGFAAMHPIGSWLVPEALTSAPEDFRYSAFNTPAISWGKGEQPSIIGLSTGYMIHAESPNFDVAVSFLRFFTSLESQILQAEAGDFSSVKGVMEMAEIDPNTVLLAQIFRDAVTIFAPPDTGYPVEIADTFYQGAAFVAGGVKSAEEALEWVDAQLEARRQR